MKQESGRSMLEIVGVLAIGVIMIASAYRMYKSIDQRQKRLVASETVEEVAKKTKILYEFSGYMGISIDELKTKGAISNTNPPIGSGWELKPNKNGGFRITLQGLSYDECKYFTIKKADWAQQVRANQSAGCKKTDSNIVDFIIQ